MMKLVVLFAVLLGLVDRSSAIRKVPENIVKELLQGMDAKYDLPDFEETFEMNKPPISMTYYLTHNHGTRLDMDRWEFEVPGEFAELQSWNTTVSIYGVFDADILITQPKRTVKVQMTGLYVLNISQMDMNHTLERPKQGFGILIPRECILNANEMSVEISRTTQNFPAQFLEELSDWISRALREDLERFVCNGITAELKKGVGSTLVLDLLRNINCAEKKKRRLQLRREEVEDGC